MSLSTTKRKMQWLASLTACGMLLVPTGCRIPDLRFAEQAPPLPTDFAGETSADNSAFIGIDQFFKDPVLTNMIAQGLAGNQELKIIEQEVWITNNEIQARRGAYLPFVALRGRAGVDKPSLYTPEGAAEEQLTYPGERHFPEPLGNFLLSADVFWQVDIWRELRNARDAAQQRYFAALERRNYFVTELVADIAENYYELAALDKRLDNLNATIDLQRQSLSVAEANKAAARGTELGVQRFQAEVQKNESEKLIIQQKIIEVENRINFLVGRYPQPVERVQWDLITLDSDMLRVGVPAQLLQNRRDIREAERELRAAGLDIKVARARFFPRLDLTAGIGFEAFSPRYLFNPEAFIANAAGELLVPLVNRKAIEADYKSANARQLQSLYDYQRTVLNAYTEVVNRISKVENYRQSVEIKLQQLQSLETSVEVATNLFQNARAEYVEVLLAQRDLLEARNEIIETKQQQLSAIVNAYQALGGGYLAPESLVPGAAYCPPGTVLDAAGVPPAPGKVHIPPAPPEAPPASADSESAPAPTIPIPAAGDAIPQPTSNDASVRIDPNVAIPTPPEEDDPPPPIGEDIMS